MSCRLPSLSFQTALIGSPILAMVSSVASTVGFGIFRSSQSVSLWAMRLFRQVSIFLIVGPAALTVSFTSRSISVWSLPAIIWGSLLIPVVRLPLSVSRQIPSRMLSHNRVKVS